MTAPTVPPMAQPAHTTPATRIYQDGKGKWQAHDVTMQYGAPVPLALALSRVAIGRTVFVAQGGCRGGVGGGEGDGWPN